MANAKKKIKNVKKVAKKIKKSKHKGLIIIIFILILGILGFLGFEYIQEKNNYNEFNAKIEEIQTKINIPNQTMENIELISDFDGYKIKWESSNDDVISANGIVKRPNFEAGDKTVTLTAFLNYEKKTFLYAFIESIIGESTKKIEYKIKVLALDPSPSDYIDMALSGIYVPSEVDDNIGLPKTAIIDGLNITWTSSNSAVIDNFGNIHPQSEDTLVTLSAKVEYDGVNKIQDYQVLVLKDERIKYILDENFDSLTESSRYSTIENEKIIYNNALICVNPTFDESSIDETETNASNNALKLRSNNEKIANFEVVSLNNIQLFSFDYQFNASVGENTYFELYLNDVLVEKIIPEKKEDFVTYNHDFLGANGTIKFVFVNNIKTEKTMIIDNLYALSTYTSDDLDDLVMMPSAISKSYVLPYSTIYGGIITWSSSDTNVISDDGIINKDLKENTKISMTASLNYRTLVHVYVFEIDIKLIQDVKDALNIYFIDICETDLGDCGESILITYNDIDILVDAGDQKESTYNCVKNAILTYSSDQILDYVIATHPDSDHIGNMANVFKDFQVNTLIKFSGENFTTQKFKNLKAAYDNEPNCEVLDIYDDIINDDNKENNYIHISDDIYIEFIDTLHYQDSESNGRSIVFLLKAYDTKVLFTGDADNLSPHSNLESSYMNYVGDIDILKVVHHGTANGTSKEYLNVLKPEVAVICNGNYLGNKHGHPHVSTIDRLAEASSIQHIYAICGGGLHCEMTASGAYKGTSTLEESKVERNGMIYLVIDNNEYKFSAKLTGDNMIDLRDTTYYKSYLNIK